MDVKNHSLLTVFHCSKRYGTVSFVDMLLEAGADVNIMDNHALCFMQLCFMHYFTFGLFLHSIEHDLTGV